MKAIGKSILVTVALANSGIAAASASAGNDEVRVLDLTAHGSAFLRDLSAHRSGKNSAFQPMQLVGPEGNTAAGTCEQVKDLNMIVLDDDSFKNKGNAEVLECLKQLHDLSGSDADKSDQYYPAVAFEGHGSNNDLVAIYGFSPTFEVNQVTIFHLQGTTVVLDGLLDPLDEATEEKVSDSAEELEYDDHDESTNFQSNGRNLRASSADTNAIVPNTTSSEGKRNMDAAKTEFMERVNSLPALTGGHRSPMSDPRVGNVHARTDIPPDARRTFKLFNDWTINIPQPGGTCSRNRPFRPEPQPGNVMRSTLDITLAMDDNPIASQRGQWIGVHHEHTASSNVNTYPPVTRGKNKSVGWFLQYVMVRHRFDRNRLSSWRMEPENQPMSSRVRFDTSFQQTVGITVSDPPSVSYEQITTEGKSIEYDIQDWGITKAVSAQDSNEWYHINKRPFDGREYFNKINPRTGVCGRMGSKGELYNGCRTPEWASLLSAESGNCEQSLLYRTPTGNGYQTGVTRLNWNYETGYSDIESWGESRPWPKGDRWESCKYDLRFNRFFSYDINLGLVKPTTL